jgi:hypothetical protein
VPPTAQAVIILEKNSAVGALHNFQLDGMLAVSVTERFGRSGGKAGEDPAHPASIYSRKARAGKGCDAFISTLQVKIILIFRKIKIILAYPKVR